MLLISTFFSFLFRRSDKCFAVTLSSELGKMKSGEKERTGERLRRWDPPAPRGATCQLLIGARLREGVGTTYYFLPLVYQWNHRKGNTSQLDFRPNMSNKSPNTSSRSSPKVIAPKRVELAHASIVNSYRVQSIRMIENIEVFIIIHRLFRHIQGVFFFKI